MMPCSVSPGSTCRRAHSRSQRRTSNALPPISRRWHPRELILADTLLQESELRIIAEQSGSALSAGSTRFFSTGSTASDRLGQYFGVKTLDGYGMVQPGGNSRPQPEYCPILNAHATGGAPTARSARARGRRRPHADRPGNTGQSGAFPHAVWRKAGVLCSPPSTER